MVSHNHPHILLWDRKAGIHANLLFKRSLIQEPSLTRGKKLKCYFRRELAETGGKPVTGFHKSYVDPPKVTV